MTYPDDADRDAVRKSSVEASMTIPTSPAIPEGWRLVPVKLIPEMRRRMKPYIQDGPSHYVDVIWYAALDAAPEPPTQ